MKCQKCGAEMTVGHLYCSICGAEYQIVPDFEPEVEYNIARSMSDITESIDEGKNKKTHVLKSKRRKAPSFTMILFLVALCSVFIYWGYSKYIHSTNYQSRQALASFNEQDYYQAAKIYEKIRKNNTEDAYWYVKEAESRVMLGEDENAYQLILSAIQAKQNVETAYDFLMSYLEKEERYIEMNQYLKECTLEDVKEKYGEYLCRIPAISMESGSYNEALELTFEKGFQGTIYYTIDNGLANNKSTKYEKSIKLGNGTHILSVVYENKFGITSEPVTYEYKITSDIPMAPMVNLSSGKYANAEMIEITVEDGTRVYYTTDLTDPTEESLEYTGPIPMPLGESRFNFIAYSEKGIAGSVSQRNYMLNIKTNITIEEAEALLIQKLISCGHILDQNGAVQGRYGVFRYFYKFPISEAEVNYYVFEEHYMENQINNPLSHFYVVDVLDGNIYKLISDGLGNFTRVEI